MCILAFGTKQFYGHNSMIKHSILNEWADSSVVGRLEITACPRLPMRRNGGPGLDSRSINCHNGSVSIQCFVPSVL